MITEKDDYILQKLKNVEFIYPYALPELSYEKDALKPYMDEQTVNIHYGKHHQGYVNKLNKAVEGTEMQNKRLTSLLRNISKYPVSVRNNGGGHYNHTLFWEVISPDGGGQPGGELAKAIDKQFQSFENFKKEFSKEAKSHFASGWAWLAVKENGDLFVTSTSGHDSPLMDIAEEQGYPILVIDVWEHAYYLKYKNLRGGFVENFWEIVNWPVVEEKFLHAITD